MLKKFFLVFVINLTTFVIYSQSVDYPKDDFVSPVGEKMLVSGNFAELRPNHFHSGIDVRTNGAVGEKIYAAADGYISRINVSPWGFGNALYINHPNGYKTVYAHLNVFNATIQNYLVEKQYELEEFSVNLYPSSDELIVKQGDVIGYSGNSGRSFGPHLHFEIRNTDTDEPVNPMFFYPNIVDNIKPEIQTLGIYPFDDTSFVAGKNEKKILTVNGSSGKYYISDDIEVYGNIIFGIEAYDYLNFVGSKNAVYSIDLFIDDTLIYSHQIDKFAFSESRYVNTMVDFEERNSPSAKRIQRSYIAPNNKLRIYNFSKNKGIYTFEDNQKHEIRFEVGDVLGNSAQLKFNVKSISDVKASEKYKNICTDYTMLMPYNCENYYISDDLRITVHKNCLYENLYFYYKKYTSESTSEYSEIHKIHNENTPLHSSITVSINADKVSEKYLDKAIIARKDNEGDITNCGGKYINGFITGKSKMFGSFFILIDTVAPTIKPLNISEGLDMSEIDKISFKVIDNLSGLETYNGYIDDKWVIFKYDGKNDHIYYEFDNKVIKGEHFLKFIVTDERGNESIFSTKFYK
jgi:hypothetical protein